MQKFSRFLMTGCLLIVLCACDGSGDSKQPVNWLKSENTQNGQQDVYLKFGKEWRRINNINKVVMLNPVRALGLAESPRYQLLQPGTLIPKNICAGGQLNWAPGRKNLDCTIIGRDVNQFRIEQFRFDLNGEVISQYQADVPYTDQELMASPFFYGEADQRFFYMKQMVPGSMNLQTCTLVRAGSDGVVSQVSSDTPVSASQCTDPLFWSSKLGVQITAVAGSDVF